MVTKMPTLSFGVDFDDRTAWEVRNKGWFDQASVNLPDGRSVRVSFWDPVRLAQDLENDLKLGRKCLAEPGMIVVPEVTVENMQAAVEDLFRRGFFDHFHARVRQ